MQSVNTSAAFTVPLDIYLNQDGIYDALHVKSSKKSGSKLYNLHSENAAQALNNEYLLGNSIDFLNYLLKNIPVLLFEGNFDARCGADN